VQTDGGSRPATGDWRPAAVQRSDPNRREPVARRRRLVVSFHCMVHAGSDVTRAPTPPRRRDVANAGKMFRLAGARLSNRRIEVAAVSCPGSGKVNFFDCPIEPGECSLRWVTALQAGTRRFPRPNGRWASAAWSSADDRAVGFRLRRRRSRYLDGADAAGIRNGPPHIGAKSNTGGRLSAMGGRARPDPYHSLVVWGPHPFWRVRGRHRSGLRQRCRPPRR
jgi:hypothetical protein